MAGASSGSPTPWRLVAHFFLTFLGLLTTYTLASGDRRAASRDLPQDYAAARAWLHGRSAYQPLDDLYAQAGFPPRTPDVMVHRNPHPPAAILLTLPFALLDYHTAVLAFVWSQLVALALTWTLAHKLFRPGVPGGLWSIAGGVFGLWAPLWQGVAWGQPVGFLALAVLVLWWLAASGRSLEFGFLLALVIEVRPFVAILAACAGGWPPRSLFRSAVGLAAGGVLPFVVIGIAPWDWYQSAYDASGYIQECGSIPGILHLGVAEGLAGFALTASILAGLRRYGLDLDSTAALGLVASLLIYPLAWFQYDTALLPVVAWLFARVGATRSRWAFWAAVVYLTVRTVPDLVPSPNEEGVLNLLARHKNEVQVLARGILLAAVVMVAPRIETRKER